ncbi:MAG: hypothetical protein D6718_09700 [Acidobacteria bacterium]|nr:MAG: hypothetical protein D6718_09700 [Acidobacteriota bacterium]
MRIRWGAALLAAGCATALAGIDQTKHNLGTTGPGEVKALTEERICIFCHAPHRARTQAPLWNREDSTATYLLYDSTTLDALPDQPTGASRMCLSCHDGTVALGDLHSEPSEIEFPAGHRYLDETTGSLGTDLGDDHPISFVYDSGLVSQDPELRDPQAIPPPVHLDSSSQLQCTSCHDPHDDTYGKFLLTSDTGGQLCTSCHDKTNWDTSVHATSTAQWDGTPPDPWPGSSDRTVADNACRSCHTPHTAAQPERLVKRAPEEEACYACHNGHVATLDIQAEFQKSYTHPIDVTQGVHEPDEDPFLMARHVECADCHEPHQAWHAPASPPAASGALRGTSGIDIDGQPVKPVQFMYEVCFKCHADTTNATQAIPRTAGEINTRLEFAPDAISFHPVAQPGKNPDVPSLIPPLTESSQIYCTDCHASDQADSGGSQGPHGSVNPFILRLNYDTDDYTPESSQAYALCYRCHSRSVLLSKNQSGFKLHKKHVVGEDAPCSACHDPHGVSSVAGDPTGNTHLISFDTRIVSPNRKGILRFEDLGTHRGSCSLKCHGEDHDRKSY